MVTAQQAPDATAVWAGGMVPQTNACSLAGKTTWLGAVSRTLT